MSITDPEDDGRDMNPKAPAWENTQGTIEGEKAAERTITFHRNADGSLSMHEAIFQALGAASMCWSQTPRGVFDDASARAVGHALLAELAAHDADLTARLATAEQTIAAVKALPRHSDVFAFVFASDLDAALSAYRPVAAPGGGEQ